MAVMAVVSGLMIGGAPVDTYAAPAAGTATEAAGEAGVAKAAEGGKDSEAVKNDEAAKAAESAGAAETGKNTGIAKTAETAEGAGTGQTAAGDLSGETEGQGSAAGKDTSQTADVAESGSTTQAADPASQADETASSAYTGTLEPGPGTAWKEAEEARLRAEAEARAAQEAAEAAAAARQNLVNYALQFVGRPYRSGGNDPHTGADCSGFVKYVMEHGAGVSMNRSSRSQATQGRAISAGEIQPGDLVFYGSGSRINHVAMYIGNGQIVHASTYKTGIKISNWNYRSPIRIVSMLG